MTAAAILAGGAASMAVGVACATVAATQRRRNSAVHGLLVDDETFERGDADVWQLRLTAPTTSRVVLPPLRRAVRLVRRLAPREQMATLRRKLLQAGLAGRLTAEEFVVLHLASVALAVGAAIALSDGSARSVALSLLAVVIGILVPPALLEQRRTGRVEQIQRELPDVIDLLAVCVEAGQGFEAALGTVARRGHGVLVRELRHTLREMEVGVSRRVALEHLRDRTGVVDIGRLVAALIQADVLGTPIVQVLRDQAGEQRSRWRTQVRERAARLPVKILVPMTVFILPALFIVVLGPAAIEFSAAFR